MSITHQSRAMDAAEGPAGSSAERSPVHPDRATKAASPNGYWNHGRDRRIIAAKGETGWMRPQILPTL